LFFYQLISHTHIKGHVGASERGLRFLENEGLLAEIVSLAENADSLSLRGYFIALLAAHRATYGGVCVVLCLRRTCYYVLGLISQSPRGRALLDGLGWESPCNNANICVPKDPASSGLFKVLALQLTTQPNPNQPT
jgi:hypothetical protein